jgi:hypothetical protein
MKRRRSNDRKEQCCRPYLPGVNCYGGDGLVIKGRTPSERMMNSRRPTLNVQL